ncbi:MAG: DUF6492 family protein [Microbacterium sp.]
MLLEVQARSMRLFVEPATVDRIFVIDNSVTGLGNRRRRRLLREYGSLAPHVTVLRTRALVDAGSATGWRSQQAAKLAIAGSIRTPHYVVLDAKNHFTRPVRASDFIGTDGRAHGRSHPYTTHPLRPSLHTTLRYVGASAEQIELAIMNFPPTATPFVFSTPLVQEMMADIESRSGLPFGEEFERQNLLEFFLYSGWVDVRGPGLTTTIDQQSLPSPTVWPIIGTVEGLRATINEAAREGAFVFAVHRQALVHADRAMRTLLVEHWVRLGLFDRRRDASTTITRFRLAYAPAMAWTRLIERAHRCRQRRP